MRIAVNPDYQGVRSTQRPQPVKPIFLMDLYALHVTRFQHCPPDGLRLQSSAAAADVL